MSGELPAGEQFDDEFVEEVLDLCIGCKGCAVDCPSGVDMAKLKAEVTNEYRERNGASLRDRLFANVHTLSALGSRFAPLSNWASAVPGARWLMERTLGIDADRELPSFHRDTFTDRFEERPHAGAAPSPEHDRKALVVPDTYTNFTNPEAGVATVSVLEAAGVDRAERIVAATGDDDTNLLIAQLARTKFGVETVLSRVNDPENVGTFESLDVTAVNAAEATAWSIDNEIERPELAHWMTQLGEGHDVQQTDLTAGDLDGQTVREVNAEIPDGCIIAVIGRGEETHVPTADEELARGDHITFLGERGAVEGAIRRFHPRD